MGVEDIVADAITCIGKTIARFTKKLAFTDSRDQIAVLNRKGDRKEFDDGVDSGAKNIRARVGFALASTI